MTFAIFHDFPGLENGLPKFRDFPRLSMTTGHPELINADENNNLLTGGKRYRSVHAADAKVSTTGRQRLTLTTTRQRLTGLTAMSHTSLGHRCSFESRLDGCTMLGLEWTLQSTVWIT